jgi:hypothetical protein
MVGMHSDNVEVHIQNGRAEILVGSCQAEPLRFLEAL